MSDSSELKAHLFICTNYREASESCAAKGSEALRNRLKEKIKLNPDWKGILRVNASGCLGRCRKGIVAVLYPEGQWFTNLSEHDEQKLLSALEQTLMKDKDE